MKLLLYNFFKIRFCYIHFNNYNIIQAKEGKNATCAIGAVAAFDSVAPMMTEKNEKYGQYFDVETINNDNSLYKKSKTHNKYIDLGEEDQNFSSLTDGISVESTHSFKMLHQKINFIIQHCKHLTIIDFNNDIYSNG